jgi:iron complex outermembrane receptor protein
MKSAYLIAASMLAVSAGTAHAQDEASTNADGDETPVIVVTGTNIRSDEYKAVAPVDIFSEDEIEATGFSTVTDLVTSIPANFGSEANRSATTQNNTLGTAQVNLRGLGLGATLVLTNGRRNVLSATFANDGSQFVDTNQFPLAIIERVEVVKTGASAVYGSDAVAGVVNFITKSGFQGAEFDAQYQTTTNSSQEDITLNFLAGIGGDATNLTVAATYSDRSELRYTDRDFTGLGTEVEFATAKPGSFVLLAPPMNPAFAGTAPGSPVVDPGCAQAGGNVLATPGGVFCEVSTRDQFSLVPNEERLSVFGELTHDFGGGLSAFLEAAYADSEAVVTGRPAALPGAGASGSILVRPDNAFNPFGAPAVFVGRPLDTREATREERSESETWRVAVGGQWEANDGTVASLSYVHAENDFEITFNDLLVSEFFIPGSTFVRSDFNLFASSLTDPAQANDPAVIDAISTEVPIAFASNLDVIEGSISGILIELSGGPLIYAVGAQWRSNSASFDADDRLNRGGELVFLFPTQDFAGAEVNAASVFTELAIPLGDAIDVQAALRYEDYNNDIGDTLDPQIAVTAEIVPDLSARASFGTSFRAPTPLQIGGTTNQVAPIVNPCTGQRLATAVVTNGNSGLTPESSTSYSAGLIYNQPGGLRASVDYWRYDYDDVITRQSAQAAAAGAQCTEVAPGVFVPIAPGITLNPATGQISQIEVDFTNAGAIETDGIDFAIGYSLPTESAGTFSADLSATLLTSFDVSESAGAPFVDRLGNRNVNSFVRPTPEFRGNLALGWENNAHRITVISRYTSSYDDDLNADASIDDFLTFDLQYALTLNELFAGAGETQLRLGAINVTDEDPPFVFDRGGYDPLVADPRGRLIYVGISQGF